MEKDAASSEEKQKIHSEEIQYNINRVYWNTGYENYLEIK